MYLSLVFDIDGYREFLIAYFFLIYSCIYCVLEEKKMCQAVTVKPSAAISVSLHWRDVLRNPRNL